KCVEWQRYLENAHADCANTLLTKIGQAMEQARRNARTSDSAADIRLLGREKNKLREDIDLLSRLLAKPASRDAAIERLSRIKSPEVVTSVLANWNSYPPFARTRIVNLLANRQDWLERLLKALEAGIVSKLEISADQRQRFIKHDDKTISVRAADLFPVAARRKEIVAKYEGVASLETHPQHGAEIFEKNCGTCHLYRGKGNDL